MLVLTGAGKVFSAGADLDAAKAGLATSPLWERLSGAIAALPGLTIAALNGTDLQGRTLSVSEARPKPAGGGGRGGRPRPDRRFERLDQEPVDRLLG